MLEKNNFIELLKNMEMQSKQYHFSIRKLSIGAASVLLCSIFLGLNSSAVKANTVDADQHVSDEVVARSDNKSKNIETRDMTINDFGDFVVYITDNNNKIISNANELTEVEKAEYQKQDYEIAMKFINRAKNLQKGETLEGLNSQFIKEMDQLILPIKLLNEKRLQKDALKNYASKKMDKEFPALTESKKQDIKNRIKKVISDTGSKIDNVKVPTNEQELTDAITEVERLEKGLSEKGEVIKNVDYGEAAIDNIFKSSHKNNGNSGTGSDTTSNQVNGKPFGNASFDKEAATSVPKGKEVTLMHNAYLYDIDRTRSNKVILKADSIANTYGTQTIFGSEYYILLDKGANNKKYYISVGNVKYLVRKLKKNAFVYNKYGKRIKKEGKIKKGQTITTYGDIVNINGKKFFIIKKGQFVKANNVDIRKIVSKKAEVKAAPAKEHRPDEVKTTKRVLMHNAYLYDEHGLRCNKLIFKAGSVVKPISKEKINGRSFYGLENGMYIAAGNIDAKKLKLKHNAYIYQFDGKRRGKKVLKKQKSVKTYGDPIKIKHKMYYIIAKGKHVKKANFR